MRNIHESGLYEIRIKGRASEPMGRLVCGLDHHGARQRQDGVIRLGRSGGALRRAGESALGVPLLSVTRVRPDQAHA